EILFLSRSLMFPGFFGEVSVTHANVGSLCKVWVERLFTVLSPQILAGIIMASDCGSTPDISAVESEAADIAAAFIARLPKLRRSLNEDVTATYHGDPAALSRQEVLYCYPGIKAISAHRIAHELLSLGVPIIPRMISELSHSDTGVDIHPAATIGRSFTIDHGTGIVVGATAIIGDNVKIFQGVTLGAKSFTLDDDGNPVKGIPRHPIIGNNVVIYANATILGRITVGDNAVIGGNVWITDDVAPGERVLQAKANANNILRVKNS
ncbi:MAG: serine acetyltransferase, partial [Muribaculum sp.]|nr:serine acetyltransferase [Muribaculum sp.]